MRVRLHVLEELAPRADACMARGGNLGGGLLRARR